MGNDIYGKSIVATASASDTKKSENQDGKGEFEGNDFNAIFVADGLGSYIYPRIAADIVINFFKLKASEINFENHQIFRPNFALVFKQAKDNLIDYVNRNIDEEEKKRTNLLGTTAIAVLETSEKIYIAYVGNGAIWHFRGNFNEFPDAYLFPWNVVNYLNPHSIPESGKEALYKLISDSNDFTESEPSIIEITKDKILGDVIMICTDGIYSADQVKAGKNSTGVWVKVEPFMLTFFKTLSNYFKNNIYSSDLLKTELECYLENIKPMLDDDATIGVLITKEALNYQNTNKAFNNDPNSGF